MSAWRGLPDARYIARRSTAQIFLKMICADRTGKDTRRSDQLKSHRRATASKSQITCDTLRDSCCASRELASSCRPFQISRHARPTVPLHAPTKLGMRCGQLFTLLVTSIQHTTLRWVHRSLARKRLSTAVRCCQMLSAGLLAFFHLRPARRSLNAHASHSHSSAPSMEEQKPFSGAGCFSRMLSGELSTT